MKSNFPLVILLYIRVSVGVESEIKNLEKEESVSPENYVYRCESES